MYEKFEQLLALKGVTSYKVTKDCGFSSGMLGNWKAGKYTPKADKLQKLADYFGVSINYFYGTEELPVELSLDEQLMQLDARFALHGPVEELTDEQKETLIAMFKLVRGIK